MVAKLVHPPGVEPGSPALQAGAFTGLARDAAMVLRGCDTPVNLDRSRSRTGVKQRCRLPHIHSATRYSCWRRDRDSNPGAAGSPRLLLSREAPWASSAISPCSVVPGAGVEPAWDFTPRQLLRLVCLPFPPAGRFLRPRLGQGPARSRHVWSGRRGSNPRPRAWEARALPTELHPHGDGTGIRTRGSQRERLVSSTG